MARNHSLTKKPTNLYRGNTREMPLALNWHEVNVLDGTYSNHTQLQCAVNAFSEFTDQEGELLKLAGTIPYASNFINLAGTFYYQSKITGTTTLSYWQVLSRVLYRPYFDVNSFYYDSNSKTKAIASFDEKHKCCELIPSNINPATGYITVPASVGKNWGHGTKVYIAPKEFILTNNAGVTPTVLPTFTQYNPYLDNNNPPTVSGTTKLFEPSGGYLYYPTPGGDYVYAYGLEPAWISLKKISDTLFQPFLFHHPQSLANNAFGPNNTQNYSYKLPFYANYPTKFFGKITSAGSNYVLNVYEPRTAFDSGTAFCIVPAIPFGHKTQSYYNPANFDAVEAFVFQSWLDNRYVDLDENKITVSEICQPVDNVNNPNFGTQFDFIGVFTNYPTGTAVQVYPSRFWKYWGYTPLAVDYMTNAPIALVGEQYIRDVFVTDGIRVLVKDQTDKKQNGLYTVKKTAWVRYDYFASIPTQNANDYYKLGTIVTVQYNANGKRSTYVIDAPFVLGTSDIVFKQIETQYGINDPDEVKDTVLPEGLERGKVYYLIKGPNWIKFAKSYQDALDGIATPLVTTGRGLIGVYVADSLIGFPEKVLTRDENGQPLTTEPLSPEKTYYLVNKGARFGLAETQSDAVAGRCLPMYQKPNTYFSLEPISYRTRTATSPYNEAGTSYIWNPLDETENCCTDMSHILPALSADGTELGIIADDVPSYLTIPITVEVPPDERLRPPPLADKTKTTWVYGDPLDPANGFYEYELDESLPDGFHNLNGNSDVTAEVNAINASLASALSGNLVLYFAGKGKARDFFPASNSYTSTYTSRNNLRPLPTHGKFLFYKGKKQAVKTSVYHATNYFWKAILGDPIYSCHPVDIATDPYYGCNWKSYRVDLGAGQVDFVSFYECGCVFPYHETTIDENGTTIHSHCGYRRELLAWEVEISELEVTNYTGMTLQVWLVVDATTGEKYAYYQVDQKDSSSWAVPYLPAPVGNYNYDNIDYWFGYNNLNGGIAWNEGFTASSQSAVTNFLVHGSYYGTGNVLYRNADSNYSPANLQQGSYQLYYFGSYYAPQSWWLTGGVDLSPASLAITNTRKFAGQTALELHFKTPIYHIWKKANPVKKWFLNGLNVTPSDITKVDYDADLSSIQDNIICTYDPETKKYKSQPLVSNGVHFRVEIVPDRDLTGIKVYGAPNSFVKMYADFEYYTTTSNNTDLALQKTDINPHPFTGNTHVVNVWTLNGYKQTKYLVGNELPILDPMIVPESVNPYSYGSYVVGDKNLSTYQNSYLEVLGKARHVAPIYSVNLPVPKLLPNENNPVTLVYLLSCSIL